jgi:hypothetical protein
MKTTRVRRNRTRARLGAAALAAVMALLMAVPFATSASAHETDQVYLYLSVSENDVAGRLEVPFSDISEVFGITLEGRGSDIIAVLEERLDELQTYAAQHVTVGADGQTWDLNFEGVELLFPNNTPDFNFVLLPFEVDVPVDEVPRVLDVGLDAFFDEIEGRDGLLLIENDWQRGVFDNESEGLVSFSAATRVHTVDLGDTSQWSNFTASIGLGLDHIRTGPDHIFFILVLLLPSVLIFTTKWEPAASFGSALWRILKVATMFTVAHSITFTLAGLDLLPLPPSRLVESIIALSIAAAALHNLFPVGANKEWAIAFAFGLFHGMGFAGLVSGLDVSRSTQLVTLLGRNVGIEVGQAIIILLMFTGLFVLRRTRFYRPVFVAVSLLLAAVASVWTIERVFQQDFNINGAVDAAIMWPRVLLPIAIFTAVCYALYRREAAADRLLDLPADDAAHSDVAGEGLTDQMTSV